MTDKEYHKKYYQDNNKKIIKRAKKYYKDNKEKIREQQKEYNKIYRETHREEINKRAKEYRKKHYVKPTYRGPSYEYVCRMLTTNNKSGDAYGFTLPAKLVKQYGLLGKKFKVGVSTTGKLYVRTIITYTEK